MPLHLNNDYYALFKEKNSTDTHTEGDTESKEYFNRATAPIWQPKIFLIKFKLLFKNLPNAKQIKTATTKLEQFMLKQVQEGFCTLECATLLRLQFYPRQFLQLWKWIILVFILLFLRFAYNNCHKISSAKNCDLYLGWFSVCFQISQLNYEYVYFRFRNTVYIPSFSLSHKLFDHIFKHYFCFCGMFMFLKRQFLQNQNTTH